jgi:hypothetical protein
VRRLTPRECERLQGFPDDYTLIPYRGKPAADGPRYKALGNSMAVPVMRWIGERIAHKVAMLLPLTFLEGQRKAPWLQSTPLARVHVFTWRISMPPGELLVAGKVKPEGGKKCFAWFVFEHGWQGPPHINFLIKPAPGSASP